MKPSFFRLSPAVESQTQLPADLPPSQLSGDEGESVAAQQPAEIVNAINATEETASLLDQKASSLEVLAQIANDVPAADEAHLTLTELAAVEIVRGTDIDPETDVVPSFESAVGGRIPTASILKTAGQMRAAAKAVRLGLAPSVESASEELPLFDATVSTEGIGADIASAMKKLFSTWKDNPDLRNPWNYGSKEIREQLQKTYANAEWVTMRGLREGPIALPKAPWAEYLVFPGDKLIIDDLSLLKPMVRQVCDFVFEMCEAYRGYKKDITPIYNRMLSQDPNAALEYVRNELPKIPTPAKRMTITDLPLPANRHIKLTEGGNFIDDWQDTEVPPEIRVLASVDEVVGAGKAAIDAADVIGNLNSSYPNFFGHDRFDWWNKAYKQLSESDFNYLWRAFNTEAVHGMNGLETASIKAMYSAVMAICAVEHILDRSVK